MTVRLPWPRASNVLGPVWGRLAARGWRTVLPADLIYSQGWLLTPHG